MAANRYTELFFLDEATSFAAGHRPCCECRKMDYHQFKSFWLKGNPEYHFTEKTSIKEIDDILQKERIDSHKSKVTYEENIEKIPDGSFVLIDNNPYLIYGKQLYLWTPFGYGKGMGLPNTNRITVLTPKSVVKTFRAGYRPQIALP